MVLAHNRFVVSLAAVAYAAAWMVLAAVLLGAIAGCERASTPVPTTAGAQSQPAAIELLNVSYDPTVELYVDVNKAFAAQWLAKTGQTVKINVSHGGSGKQARALATGLQADVASLALAYDIDELVKVDVIGKDWQAKLPQNSSPYFSTIVFLVRKGNPRGIKDWSDLARQNTEIVMPDPRTSGGARWNYLAAYAFGQKKFAGDEAKTLELIKKIYANAKSLDSGARGSTARFQRGEGDVLVSWENEALLLATKKAGEYQVVVPSISVLAEPPVTVLDKWVKERGTAAVAEAYVSFLYTPEGQELIAKHFYRPQDASVQARYQKQFEKLQLVGIDTFGGWQKAHAEHFASGGKFDGIVK